MKMNLIEAKEILNRNGFILEDSKYDSEYARILKYFPTATDLKIQKNRSIRNSNYVQLYGWECFFRLNGKQHYFTFGLNCFGFISSFESYIAKYCKLDSFKDYLEMKNLYPEATLEDIREIGKMG